LIGSVSASHLCAYGRWKKRAGELHEVFGQQVYFAAKRIAKGRDPFLAVISYGFSGHEAFELYRQRWGIETFFSHLKKRGFKFEDIHMTKKERIEKLLGVLAVSFALCYRWGQEQEKKEGLKLKTHGHHAKSVFRQGFESLHRLLKSPARYAAEIAAFFHQVLRLPLIEKIVV
jgi:IS4 transposase